jgi:hypothetical protein
MLSTNMKEKARDRQKEEKKANFVFLISVVSNNRRHGENAHRSGFIIYQIRFTSFCPWYVN